MYKEIHLTRGALVVPIDICIISQEFVFLDNSKYAATKQKLHILTF